MCTNKREQVQNHRHKTSDRVLLRWSEKFDIWFEMNLICGQWDDISMPSSFPNHFCIQKPCKYSNYYY